MNRSVIAGLTLMAIFQGVRAALRGRAAQRAERWQHPSAPAAWPSVSIILPAWRERGTLESCLTRLRKIDYEDYEVIVVAGGPDGTFKAANRSARHDPRITVMRQRATGGKNGAINDGARRASKEVLVFIDADALVTREWLKALVAPLADGYDGGLYDASTGKYAPVRRTLISEVGEMSQVLENEARGRVILQGSGGMAVRRSAFDAIGGIPEGRYADDWALSARLQEQGYRLAYAPGAFEYTERPATLGEWWANEVRWRRLHLLTLFEVAPGELRTPISAAKALYPYAAAWTVVILTAAAVVARACRLGYRAAAEVAWAAVVGAVVTRELAGAVETAAYAGQTRWLRTMAVIPVLTVLGWLASVFATLTTGKAGLHFKGPRSDAAETLA
ncbi:MAG: glycosyltransferase [Nitrososphaerales archaeon]